MDTIRDKEYLESLWVKPSCPWRRMIEDKLFWKKKKFLLQDILVLKDLGYLYIILFRSKLYGYPQTKKKFFIL